MKVYGVARSMRSEDDLRLTTLRRDVAHDGLELREDLRLAQGQLDVPLLIVEQRDHILDLRTDISVQQVSYRLIEPAGRVE